ncbi:cation-transporting P-type ATPase [Streptomyces collinus]
MSPERTRPGTTVLHEAGRTAGSGAAARVPSADRPATPAPAVPSLPVPAVFAALDSSPRGLTPAETAVRRDRYGPNVLPGVSHARVWRRLLAQLPDRGDRTGDPRGLPVHC